MNGAAPGLAAPLLLYDGDCAFCARSVRFLLDHDRRRRTARVAPRAGATGGAVLARHPAAAAVDSLVWVEHVAGGERALVRGDAVLAIARYLGGAWAVGALAGSAVPRRLRNAAYDWLARRRRHLRVPGEACLAVTAGERWRLLE